MKIRKHIPNFIDADRPVEQRSHCIPDLLASPTLSSWSSDPEFSHFELSRHPLSDYLMARMKSGHFYVVAYLNSESKAEEDWLAALPFWELTDADRERVGLWNRGGTS